MAKKNNIASVVVDGNLTVEPEFKIIPNGSHVTSFTIAVNQDEDVSYFTIETWGKTADNCKEYLKKGSGVTVIGNLKQKRWKTPDGGNGSKIVITANSVRFDYSPRTGESNYDRDNEDQGEDNRPF
jgi:single-strand DNA-binding protein